LYENFSRSASLYFPAFVSFSTHSRIAFLGYSALCAWTPHSKIVIPNGAKGQWDQYSIHDPYPLVYKGKIYLYYKSDCDGDPRLVRMQGLAIADHPLGPFKKHPLNPVSLWLTMLHISSKRMGFIT